jgi:hypothetical protein
MNLGDNIDLFDLLDDATILPALDISSSKFMQLAITNNLLVDDQKFTIFLPPDHLVDDEDFEMFWNRHTTSSLIPLHQNCVIQVKMSSSITYGIYSIAHDMYIGSIQIHQCNQVINNCIIHEIDSALYDLSFTTLSHIPLVVLSHQMYELAVNPINDMHIKSTINIGFFECDSRTQLGCIQRDWNGNKLPVIFDIPSVNKETHTTMWVEVVADELRIPLISWMRPHRMTIYPNLDLTTSPVIYDINPSKGTQHQALWIHGDFFSPQLVRVSVGCKFAVIYSCTPSLVKCIVPENTAGTYNIQVANGNTYTTAEKKFTYST